MMRRMLAGACLLACMAPGWAADPCPPTNTGEEWSPSCFEGSGATLRVKPQYLKRIKPNKYGRATLSAGLGYLVAVDRAGKVVLAGISFAGDFDYPDAYKGIGRFYPNGAHWDRKPEQKCGYFESKRFGVVIPARYDACTAFHESGALACVGCQEYCSDEDCHQSVFVGGHADVLAVDGSVRKRYALPTLETVCGKHGPVRLSPPGSYPPILRCEGEKNPFDQH